MNIQNSQGWPDWSRLHQNEHERTILDQQILEQAGLLRPDQNRADQLDQTMIKTNHKEGSIQSFA